MKTIHQIFNPKPEQWGFRGDPYLWDDLEKYFSERPFPADAVEFKRQFSDAFRELTGAWLEDGRDIFVEKYNHGGMSRGMISHEFWIERGLPLLAGRFER